MERPQGRAVLLRRLARHSVIRHDAWVTIPAKATAWQAAEKAWPPGLRRDLWPGFGLLRGVRRSGPGGRPMRLFIRIVGRVEGCSWVAGGPEVVGVFRSPSAIRLPKWQGSHL